jgi:VIT1/CCC1 family predicted Fe2+/Mn2+ transporter
MNAFPNPHEETHRSHRAAWLRAAVLGLNDGVVSTSSLMLGVLAASGGNDTAVLTAGIAGLAAGALSMAAGEYVSVSSQLDSELSDIEIERKSIDENPEAELQELAWIYQKRGLDATLAQEVARQLHEHDAVNAHVQSELGINHDDLANPMQAAVASAAAFAVGALVPILAAVVANQENGVWVISITSVILLFASGAIGAAIGGGHKLKAALRVFVGGGLAMAITFAIGHLIGASV